MDNDVRFDPDLDIVLVFGDAYASEMLERIGSKTFDLIIDDGSHEPLDQAWFVNHYAPLLSTGGVLIVEDVLTPATVPALVASMPEGFNYSAVEMPEGQSQVDSRLFLVWRRNVVHKS